MLFCILDPTCFSKCHTQVAYVTVFIEKHKYLFHLCSFHRQIMKLFVFVIHAVYAQLHF